MSCMQETDGSSEAFLGTVSLPHGNPLSPGINNREYTKTYNHLYFNHLARQKVSLSVLIGENAVRIFYYP